MELILASSSARRQDLLEDAGVLFRSESPQVDEWNSETHPNLSSADIASANARLKAKEVASRHQKATILAADTVVYCQGKLLGKPEDLEEAKKMLQWLSGKSHEVITAVVWIEGVPKQESQVREHVERTRVTFRKLTDAVISDYLNKVYVLDKAGSYALQENGDQLIEYVEGSRSNVIGLPMEVVLEWWNKWNEKY